MLKNHQKRKKIEPKEREITKAEELYNCRRLPSIALVLDDSNHFETSEEALRRKLTFWIHDGNLFPWCKSENRINWDIMDYEFVQKQVAFILREITQYSGDYTFYFDHVMYTYPGEDGNVKVFASIRKGEYKEFVEDCELTFKTKDEISYVVLKKNGNTYEYVIKPSYWTTAPKARVGISVALAAYEKVNTAHHTTLTCTACSDSQYHMQFINANRILDVEVDYPGQHCGLLNENKYMNPTVFENKLLNEELSVEAPIIELYNQLRLHLAQDCLSDYSKVFVQKSQDRLNQPPKVLEYFETHKGAYRRIQIMEEDKTISVYADGKWTHIENAITCTKDKDQENCVVAAKDISELEGPIDAKQSFEKAEKDVEEVIKLAKTMEANKKISLPKS